MKRSFVSALLLLTAFSTTAARTMNHLRQHQQHQDQQRALFQLEKELQKEASSSSPAGFPLDLFTRTKPDNSNENPTVFVFEPPPDTQRNEDEEEAIIMVGYTVAFAIIVGSLTVIILVSIYLRQVLRSNSHNRSIKKQASNTDVATSVREPSECCIIFESMPSSSSTSSCTHCGAPTREVMVCDGSEVSSIHTSPPVVKSATSNQTTTTNALLFGPSELIEL